MSKQIIACLGLPVSADHKKVLLTKRNAPNYPAWHNKWQIAGGGLEIGETTEEGVVRELWEELQVKATIIYPHPIVRTNYWTKAEGDEGIDFQVVLITYLVDIGNQAPDLSHDTYQETSEWGWFSKEDVKELDFLPKAIELVEDAFSLLAKL
ncbi:MAG: NUDIX domain-containing protein [Candidatus Moraniibacteriota bacterium]|nr:MAG: NUDIX domain-containing protein [Candidatus Moranbacteria bacterium]